MSTSVFNSSNARSFELNEQAHRLLSSGEGISDSIYPNANDIVFEPTAFGSMEVIHPGDECLSKLTELSSELNFDLLTQ